MKLIEHRENEPPRRPRALTELDISLTRNEIKYIQRFAEINEYDAFSVKGSSTVIDLIKAIKEVDLGG